MMRSTAQPSPVCPVAVTPVERQTPEPRFPEAERRFLLSQPGISDGVVSRLESTGFHSLDDLRRVGADKVVLTVCASLGTIAWANRRRYLANALSRSILLDIGLRTMLS